MNGGRVLVPIVKCQVTKKIYHEQSSGQKVTHTPTYGGGVEGTSESVWLMAESVCGCP